MVVEADGLEEIEDGSVVHWRVCRPPRRVWDVRRNDGDDHLEPGEIAFYRCTTPALLFGL